MTTLKQKPHKKLDPDRLAKIISNATDPYILKRAYNELVTQATRAGSDPLPFKRKVFHYQILEFQKNIGHVSALKVITPQGLPATGPQCKRFTNKVYTFAEAKVEDKLPCGPDCVCRWGPVFHDEY